MSRFHRLYYDNPDRTWMNTTWLGVDVLKCPLDLWIYQELITRVRPDLVIETGTAQGGSALFMASCMDLIDHGRVITIDIEPRDRPAHPRLTYVNGSSVEPQIVQQIRREARTSSTVMVILDSDHAKEHVLAELREYASLVTPGSYLIVEDTNVDGRPVMPNFGPGPHDAVDAFLAADRSFVRDESCEKFFLTFNPGGFLRRLDSDASLRSAEHST